MPKFKSKEDAKNYFARLSIKKAKEKYYILNISQTDLDKFSIKDLRSELQKIDEFLNDPNDEKVYTYLIKQDFIFEDLINFDLTRISYNTGQYLIEKKREIIDLIREKEEEQKIESISELIKTIPEKDIQQKIKQELKELGEQSNKFKIEDKKLDAEEEKFKSEQRQLELQQSKLEIFDKKSQVWLRIFGKESIASILGGFLLLVMSISFIAAMFTGTEVSNIVESAFLLILGYFFGQSVKNDK